MDREETICFCVGVTAGEIEDAVKNGAATYEEVQEITNCGTVCGGCEDNIRALIDELLSNN